MQRTMALLILALIWVPGATALTASERQLPAIAVSPEMTKLAIAPSTEGLAHEARDLGDVRAAFDAAETTRFDTVLIAIRPSRATNDDDALNYWVRFRLVNDSGETVFTRLGFGLRRNQEIDTYVLNGEGDLVKATELAVGTPTDVRELNFGIGDILPLAVAPGETVVYARVFNVARLHPTLVSTALWFDGHGTDLAIFGLLGVVVGLVLYSFLVFLAIRDLSYVYYVLFLISVGLAAFGSRAAYEVFPPTFSPYQWQFLTMYAFAGYGIFQLLFTRQLLQTRQTARFTEWIYLPLIVIIALAAIITQHFTIVTLLAFTGGAVNMVLVAILAARGVPQAGIFLIAFAVAAGTNFAFVATLVLGASIDTIYNQILTDYLLPASQVFEMTLLAFALAARIRRREQETINAQQLELESQQAAQVARGEALHAAEEAAEALESAVAERTHELEGAIEDLKSTQTQMVRTEKMAAVGQLVAGVAHELNTPLGYLKANVEVLRDLMARSRTFLTNLTSLTELAKAQSDEPQEHEIARQLVEVNTSAMQLKQSEFAEHAADMIDDADFGLTHIGNVTRSLQRVSHAGAENEPYVSYALSDALENAVTLSNNLHRGQVEILRDYEDDVPEVACAPSSISQVFLNLISNAIGACKEESSPQINLRLFQEGDSAVVAISDNGHGMSPEVQSKIFDPFFTTKRVGEGTGLGLSISLSILEEHGADVSVDSTEGEGTTFTVRFPLAISTPTEQAASA